MDTKYLRKRKRRVLKIFGYFFSVILFFLLTKLLITDIYKIPSSSMESELFTSDVILVNKLKYGPRLPRSPFDIPLINIPFHFSKNAKKRIKEYWWPYKRMWGTSNVTQGEVIVFNSTWKKDFILVKRCVGLPGDKLTIKGGSIFRNDKIYVEPNSVKKEYLFTIRDKRKLTIRIIDSLQLDINYRNNQPFVKGFLTKQELNYLITRNLINLVKDTIVYKNKTRTFDKTKTLSWTIDNMGPFIVPYKGMKIEMNLINFFKYRKAINSCEGVKIKRVKGVCYINDKKVSHFTFTKDYFFMMGDNRSKSKDSRAWGFVPEENIIGKVQNVLYSYHGGKFNWDRFLKSVD